MAAAFGAFRHRSYRLYFAGFLISLIGVWMQRVAQSWFVLELTDSAFWVGAVDAIAALPMLLFTLYAGTLADRVAKRRLIIITQAVAAVGAVSLAALVLGNWAVLWHVIVIAAAVGTANAFGLPARQAFIAEMVGRDDLTSAIALNSTAFNASRMVGPALAGIVVATLGVGACFLANGVSYLAFIGALWLIPVSVAASGARRQSAAAAMRQGWHFVVRTPAARQLVLNIAVFSVFGLPTMVLMPVFARDVIGGGAVEYGWLMSAVGVGAVFGALALAAFGHKLPRERVAGWAAAVAGALVLTLAFARSIPVAVVILSGLGLCMTAMTALTNTLLQTMAPEELRGRVISFYAFAFLGLSPIGALQAGVVAERFGVSTAIFVGGLLTLVSALGLGGVAEHDQ